MKRWTTHPRVLMGLAVLLLWVCVMPVHAAAPRLVLIHGPLLRHPVILSDWHENLQLIPMDDAGVTAADLDGRPFFDLALFWGPTWDDYVARGQPLAALQPEQANQHARFYPAHGTARPLFVFESIPGPGPLVRQMDARNLAVLVKLGSLPGWTRPCR